MPSDANSSGLSADQKRRDKLDIIAQILSISSNGALKTQMMNRASLSFAQLNHYLTLAVKAGLLEMIHVKGKQLYRITEKGMLFLQLYGEITQLIGIDNLDNQVRIN
ncbi:MAG: winged helix-turn-helix domain-containing protein, partial [Candidatus Bathyarchaeota archaeon]|nr:winged helix-turn-helix domain-containing protein [Candidatus Bathyarchaeota archaeon]